MNGSEEFDNFEQELTRVLKRVETPEGFAARVMERAAAAPVRAKVLAFPKPRARMSAAIAAVLLLGAFTGELMHHQRRQQRAATANQQFETATRITDLTIQRTRQQLERAGISLGK